MGEDAARGTPPRATLVQLAVGYLRISLSSVGGGMSAWAHRVIVLERHWLSENEFLTAYTLSRLLPGATQANLAIYVGTRLRGWVGALAALAGVLLVPIAIILAIGIAYFHYGNLPGVAPVLHGLAAGAVGMVLSMGLRIAIGMPRRVWTVALAVAAFVTAGPLHWPMWEVILILAPIGIVLAWPRRTAAEETRG
jgi:chromate transporter